MESSKALCLIVFVVAFLVTSSAAGRGEGLGFNDLANQGIHTLEGLNDLARQGIRTLEGLMAFNDLANQGDINNKYKACCDSEACTKSIPPQCRCEDVGTTCRAACKNCKCTKSNPPQCRCTDITLYSHGRCTCSATNII